MDYEWVQHILATLLQLLLAIPLSIYDRLTESETNVDNEVVVITGAGGGIGSCVAVEFAKLGAKLVLIDRDEQSNEKTKLCVQSHGCRDVMCVKCDITDPNSVQQIAAKVVNDPKFGSPRVLVCNAGILVGKYFMDHSEAEIKAMFDVNTLGYFWTIRAFFPHMLNQGSGHIAMVISASAYGGHKHLSAYSSSKYALRGLMESLTMELQERYNNFALKISGIYPFIVQTPMVSKFRIESNVPLLTPEYVAEKAVPMILKGRREIFVPFYDQVTLQMLKGLMPYRLLDAVGQLMDVEFIPKN